MASVSMRINLGAPAERVWHQIGAFGSLADWHPAIDACEADGDGVGALRTLTLSNGATVVERLDAQDTRSVTYSFVESPLPVDNYRATLRVLDHGDGTCVVEWSSTFEPAGVSESEAVGLIEGIYDAGFTSLKESFRG